MALDSELGLLERLRAGDATALEVLVHRFASRLYRVAHGITRSEADAEEVVQDAFVALFRKVEDFEGRASLGTWLYRVATNAALSRRRGSRAQSEIPLEDHLPTFLEDGHRAGDPAFLLADWSQTPEERLLARETRDVLSRAIANLSERHRAVLVLRDWEGLSNEETAEILEESVASVKSRLHRARMAVREQLTRHLGPRPRPAGSDAC